MTPYAFLSKWVWVIKKQNGTSELGYAAAECAANQVCGPRKGPRNWPPKHGCSEQVCGHSLEVSHAGSVIKVRPMKLLCGCIMDRKLSSKNRHLFMLHSADDLLSTNWFYSCIVDHRNTMSYKKYSSNSPMHCATQTSVLHQACSPWRLSKTAKHVSLPRHPEPQVLGKRLWYLTPS